MQSPILTISTFLLLFVHQGLSVENCYVCLDQCEELQSHSCKEDGFSQNIDIKCFSIQVESGGLSTTEKGCLPADVADDVCTRANQVSGKSCSVCDTDLCNGYSADAGSAVTSFLSSLLLVVTCLAWKFL